MTQILTTILALGLVLVMPALCTAGLIEHPCECGSAVGCHHESDCSDDPCGNDVVVSRPQGRNIDSALPMAMTAAGSPLPIDTAAARPAENVDSGAPPGARTSLHASDVPLLI